MKLCTVFSQLLCVFLFLVTLAASDTVCPSGWMQYEKRCYKAFNEDLNFSSARSTCEFYGGNLATIPTRSANDFVQSSFRLNSSESYWIGLYQTDWSIKPWHWMDGTEVWQQETAFYSDKLDLILLVDGSGSVGSVNFEVAKAWIIELTRKFDVSLDKTRVGVIQYSSYNGNRPLNDQPTIRTEIQLGSYDNYNQLDEAVRSISYLSGGTNTPWAMQKAIQDFETSNRFNESSTQKVLVVITDGQTSDASYLSSTTADLQNKGITTFALGIANANQRQLEVITGGDVERVYFITGFENLSNVSANLSIAIKSLTNRLDSCCSNLQNCAALSPSGSWNTLSCTNTRLPFICSQWIEMFDVSCYADYITLTVHSSYYTRQGIDLKDLHLSDISCTGKEDESVPSLWIFNTSTLSSCSTSFRENYTHLMYSNTINNARISGVYHGIILYNTFSCVYQKDLEDISLFSSGYYAIENVKNFTAPSGFGEFPAELNLYTDNTHTAIDRRTQFSSTHTLYVMMKLGTSLPDLTITIGRCWITATPDLNHVTQYSFIEQGCPTDENQDVVKITASGVGHTASFESPVFAFVDYSTAYLHCSMQICSLAGGNTCTPICSLGKRSLSTTLARHKRQADSNENYSDVEILSVGPFTLFRDETSNENASDLPIPSLIAILVAVVIIVIALLVFAGFYLKRKRSGKMARK